MITTKATLLGKVIWFDFDLSVGREIKKRRPAIVASSDAFNLQTGFVTICPITSTIRDLPFFINLHGTAKSMPHSYGQLISCPRIGALSLSKKTPT
ncbi:type II toxin-antitoxin system PemK/MazF family toxin [Lentilactobacillus rapi]|uniref:type II toxin-antitoxin system PemK/MazF family toxin n=1 Tax=Lentilactobacillus rapi TaxID=481723 RepID=UPI003FCE13E3